MITKNTHEELIILKHRLKNDPRSAERVLNDLISVLIKEEFYEKKEKDQKVV